MGTTTELRQEIKHRFVPFMAERGFAFDMRNAPTFFEFRKTAPDQIYLCDIQWDKYGKSKFRLNFGRCAPEGGVSHDGKAIAADAMVASWCNDNGYLNPKGSVNSWFSQDRPWLQRLFSSQRTYSVSQVIDSLITWFSEVEQYWTSGVVGPHIYRVRY